LTQSPVLNASANKASAAPAVTSTWTQSLEAGTQPEPAQLRDHLVAVHSAHAGFTEGCAAQCVDASGRNSYQLLADVIDPARHARALDLACGSGVLLDVCQRKFGAQVALTGIDMSADELALARVRLPDPAIKLHAGLAQDLAFLGADGFDVVLCHWALTLMGEVPAVLGEIGKVLAPGGVFSAIVDGAHATAPGYDEVNDIIYGAVRKAYPAYGEIELGDPRVRTDAALHALVAAAFPAASIEIRSTVVTLRASPDVLAREAAGFFYAIYVLSPEAKMALLADLEAFFANRAVDGVGVFAMPINQLIVQT